MHGLLFTNVNISATIKFGHMKIKLTLDTVNMGANGLIIWSLSMISSPFCQPCPVQFPNISLPIHPYVDRSDELTQHTNRNKSGFSQKSID